jgi:GTP-binding protein HflX
MLVAAFRATLEEVVEADVILHVRDISHEDSEPQQRAVEAVLRQLGIAPETGKVIEVWNKIDCLDVDARERLRLVAARQARERPCFPVSAETGEGLDALLAAVETQLASTRITLELSLDAGDGAGLSWLHRNAEVLSKELQEGRYFMTVRLDRTRSDTAVTRFDAKVKGENG